jgi:rhomboid protease GluP
MCPNCRAFITTADKICPYCEVQVAAKAVDRRPSLDTGGFMSSTRFVTSVMLILNFGLFAATLLQSSQTLGRFSLDPTNDALIGLGGMFSPLVARGEWWRLITAGFLHGGVLHILMNSWVLFDLGPAVDSSFGTNRFLSIYFVSTITGFLASFYYGTPLSIGASRRPGSSSCWCGTTFPWRAGTPSSSDAATSWGSPWPCCSSGTTAR